MSFETLASLGWDAFFDTAFEPHRREGRAPARVVGEAGPWLWVAWAGAEALAQPTVRERRAAPAPRRRADGDSERAAVGDWVALEQTPGAERLRIHALLPRRSALVRQAAGRRSTRQVLAANVDTALLVMGLDDDFNPRRLERALLLVWQGGAAPVVVLNKADVCETLAERVAELGTVAAGVPLVSLSARTGGGVESLEPWLAPGRTLVLLGSSGVGKSTLLNRLLGAERQRTQPVRAHDGRGQHTTAARALLRLPGGALVIDTPGLRELQLLGGAQALDTTFAEIAALASGCAFRDCRHRGEPGCAVAAAVAARRLDAERLASFHKLAAELAHQARRHDEDARAAERRRWRAIHKSLRGFDKRRSGR